MADYSRVPQALKDLPHWVVWKLETRKGKETKVPYATTGGFAKSNDSTTWATFEKAAEAADVLSGNDYDGIGFMLQQTQFVGIDFDGVVDAEGKPDAYVLFILEALGNPYSEITPSGKGLRCFVECASLPEGNRKFSADHFGAEIYIGNEGGRYLTITGRQFSGEGIPKVEDISLPYFLISQIRNDKFKRLWTGDASDFGNDISRADLALLALLSRLLDTTDRELLTKYFKTSALGHREKWVEREDYRDRTFKKLLSGKKTKSSQPSSEPEPSNWESPAFVEPEPEVPAEPIFRRGDEVKLKKINWLWKDRIPLGKITLFAGNPDNGKSLVSTWVAASCTIGRDFPDAPNPLNPCEVLMLLGEDDIEDTAGPRLLAAGADLTKIQFMEAVKLPKGDERDVRLDQDMQMIEKCLDQFPDIKVIVIDPISNYLGEVSMVAEQEARSILIPLKRIAAARNIAIIIVMHLNKKSELDAISRVGGAMAFIGVARASWLFIRDEKPEDEDGVKQDGPDTFSMLKIKNNLARADKNGMSYEVKTVKLPVPELADEWVPYVAWAGSVEHTADDALGSKRDRVGQRPAGRPDTEMREAAAWLQDFLQNGPKPQKLVEENAKNAADISLATLRRAKKAVGVKSYQQARVWIWELPEANATAQTVSQADREPGEDEDEPIQGNFDVE